MKQVQQLMAHTEERVTKGYQAGHETKYTGVEIAISADVQGGTF